MSKLKVMSVFGTRPEAIKMAPLALELQRRESIESLICVTAQHREMLDSVMHCFGLRADADLNIMGKNQTLTDVTVKALKGLEGCFAEFRPDLVLVHGDTSTTFSAALAAFYAKIPVGHVEAGLRTYDRYSPFPEEMNRCLVGRLATLHFAPTAKNAENLRAEAVTGDIFVTGNTVIDAMKYTVGDGGFASSELKSIDFSKRVIAMTCHRRENYGEPMKNIFSAVRTVALTHPDVEIVYPVHLSRGKRVPCEFAERAPHRAARCDGYAPAHERKLHGHDRLRRHSGGGALAGQACPRSAPRDRAPRGRCCRHGQAHRC